LKKENEKRRKARQGKGCEAKKAIVNNFFIGCPNGLKNERKI
jgi:hypothetical protein